MRRTLDDLYSPSVPRAFAEFTMPLFCASVLTFRLCIYTYDTDANKEKGAYTQM